MTAGGPVGIKVIGATLRSSSSLTPALKKLGFKPYDIRTVIYTPGMSAARVWGTIVRQQRPLDGTILTGYDAVVGLPAMRTLDEIVTANPEAKVVLLVDPSPEECARTYLKAVKKFEECMGGADNIRPLSSNDVWMRLLKGMWPADGGSLDAVKLSSDEDIDRCVAEETKTILEFEQYVQALVPAEQLLVVTAEGLDWEVLCPFLNVPLPDTPFFPETPADPIVTKAQQFATAVRVMKVVAVVGFVAVMYLSRVAWLVFVPESVVTREYTSEGRQSPMGSLENFLGVADKEQ